MLFNRHSRLEGLHACLSASKYHWVNYDDEKLVQAYRTHQAAQKGTRMHALAHMLIREGESLPVLKRTFNMYVNDALEFGMRSEQVLYVSDNAFGTADTISFRDNLLRIHDLKTGVNRTSMWQLIVYTAYFCIEYDIDPHDIMIELRIYQNDEVKVYVPTVAEVMQVINRTLAADKIVTVLRLEEEI
jgi:hypothetical protein